MLTVAGIDLAWTSYRPSGVCVVRDRGRGFELVALFSRVIEPSDVVRLAVAGENTITAVDAPLIVEPGRTAERRIAAVYGTHQASAFLATMSFLTKFNLLRGPETGAALHDAGVCLDPRHCGRPGRLAIEVYPHAAHIALFDIPVTLKFKKGRVLDRCTALREYQGHLRRVAGALMRRAVETAAMEHTLTVDPGALRGKARKALEDRLDAITCALVGIVASGGPDAIDVFGDDPLCGHIVVPRRRAG